MNASKMLDLARATDKDRPTGCVSHGRAIVSYDRIAHTYDVGTVATSHATGKRAAVLPALEALLAA